MIKKIAGSLLVGSLLSFAVSAKSLDFGGGADMSKLTAIASVLNQPDQFIDKAITVKGRITAVCAKSGCWMDLAADKPDQRLKIKAREAEMVFPVSAKGKTAYATGTLSAKKLNQQQAISYLEHMAKDSKQSFDPTTVNAGITIYQLNPTGVTIAD